MTIYQYKRPLNPTEQELNELGLRGWRIVSAVNEHLHQDAREPQTWTVVYMELATIELSVGYPTRRAIREELVKVMDDID